MFVRYKYTLLFAALWSWDTCALSNARKDVVDTDREGGAGEPVNVGEGADAEGWEGTTSRDMAVCSPLACIPTVRLATLAQAYAAGGPELNYYDTLADPLVCKREVPTVMQLSGVAPCAAVIDRVQLTLLYKGAQIRGFTEMEAPYTVFGDNSTFYGSRLLQAGAYSLSVTIRRKPSGCVAGAWTFPFNVVVCPPTSSPTPPPTTSPTPPPYPGTYEPTPRSTGPPRFRG
jgi:hypothetical protein